MQFLQLLSALFSLNFLSEVPQDVVTFYLYTKKFALFPRVLTKNNLQIFDASKETKIIMHGWDGSSEDKYCQNMKVAYLIKGDYNVILLDWSPVASKNYVEAFFKVKTVGKIIGKKLIEFKINPKNVHIVAHSLGAQIASFAAKEYTNITGNKIRRLTGLDPAGPGFDFPLKIYSERIDSSDAAFVDIIHVDGGVRGMISPVGTVDFYPNGGKSYPLQPYCHDLEPIAQSSCNHAMSNQYFLVSIYSYDFIAVQCQTYSDFNAGYCKGNNETIMGENVPEDVSGIYYLKTTNEAPYVI